MADHLIQKQILQLRLRDTEHAWEQQEALAEQLQRDGLRVMEEVFDEIAGSDTVWRIDTLEVELGNITAGARAEVWQERFRSALKEAVLRQVQQDASEYSTSGKPGSEEAAWNNAGHSTSDRLSREAATWEAWLHFLAHGRLPWWFPSPVFTEWEFALLSVLQVAPEARVPELLRLLSKQSNTLPRLLRQHSAAFLVAALKALRPGLSALVEPWQQQLAQGPETIWRAWLKQCWVLAAIQTPEVLEKRMHELSRHSLLQNQALTRATPEIILDLFAGVQTPTDPKLQGREPTIASAHIPAATPAKEEGLYIQNAGLVILAPFLPSFFDQLGLVSGGRFLSPESGDQALQLLHFLASGTQQAPEYELVLEKILCGLPEDYPPDAHIVLSDVELEEADALLKAVIEHWSALGACSPPSLRAMFLQREGKISRRSNDYVLQVEAQTVDILLNRLPWGFGMIKLPWMAGFLHTEWTY